MGVKLYHYTTKKNAEAIRQDGKIRKSSSGIAGPGVYLTALSPKDKGRRAITWNNYDGYRFPSDLEVNTEFAFEFDSDSIDAKKATNADGRDVWIVKSDVPLSKCHGFYYLT